MSNDFSVETEKLDILAKSFARGAENMEVTGSRLHAGFSTENSPFGQGQAAASATEAYAVAREQMTASCQRLAELSRQTHDALKAGSRLYASVEDSNTLAARSFSPGG